MAERRLPPIDDVEAALPDLARHIDHPRQRRAVASGRGPTRGRRPPRATVAAGSTSRSPPACSWSSCSPSPHRGRRWPTGWASARSASSAPSRCPTAPGPRSGSATRCPWTRPQPRAVHDPRSSSLGTPSAVYVGEPSADSVTLLWGPGDDVPGVADHGRRRVADRDAGIHRSLAHREAAGTGHDPRDRGRGRRAALLDRRRPARAAVPGSGRTARRDTTRLAANTLLWEADGVTFRLESSLDRDAAVDAGRRPRAVA